VLFRFFFRARFCSRFGVVLGAVLVAKMVQKWTPERPKYGPERFRRRFFSKKVIFHETIVKPMVFEGFCLPRRHRKRPKIAPRRPQDGLEEVLLLMSNFVSDFGAFWVRFGCRKDAQMEPKWHPKRTKIGHEIRHQKKDLFKTVLGASWGDLGAFLVPSWEHVSSHFVGFYSVS